jgi:hypothetical protein
MSGEQHNGYRADGRGHRLGDWSCRCGQAYRVLATAGEIRMWPRNSNEGYALEPIGEQCVCGIAIGRGTVLSALFGARAAV